MKKLLKISKVFLGVPIDEVIKEFKESIVSKYKSNH